MRDLATLTLPRVELSARLAEGICPGCAAAMEVRDLVDDERIHGDSCGWCGACEWGWSIRALTGAAPVVVVYSAGALA